MRRNLLAFLIVAVCGTGAVPAARGAIFSEDWETPGTGPGDIGTLPAPWVWFNTGPFGTARDLQPGASLFATPLASPAGGNRVLFLAGVNTGIYRMSGELIHANTTYTLSAAIGADLAGNLNTTWSLALWADTDHTGSFSVGDTFIGQQFGTNLGAVNPAPGQWATNSFAFDSATTSSLVGQQLIVFLNNFNLPGGSSYYDNVTLAVASDQTTVPEPGALCLWLGAVAAAAFRWRRRAIFAMPESRATLCPGG